MASTREAARPLFTINGAKWLEYAPLKRHALPELVYANPDLGDEATDAVFVRRERKGFSGATTMSPSEAALRPKGEAEEDVMFRRRLYRLEWAGTHFHGDDGLPCELLRHWGGAVAARAGSLPGDARVPFLDAMLLRANDKLLHELPEKVAYHAAVGLRREVPVGNLPGRVVQSVVDARFALDANYHAAAVYLKWLAESHTDHPLLTGFDTGVRDRLHRISVEATRLYFYMLGDQLYDEQARFYARGDLSDWWDQLATYLFWVGRTGSGLYESFADWPVRDRDGWPVFAKALPDVVERMAFYEERGHHEARRLAHATGRDPAVVDDVSAVEQEALLLDILVGLDALLREKLGERAEDGMTARAIVAVLYPDPPSQPASHMELRDAIEHVTRCLMGKRPDAIRLGKFLVKHREHVVGVHRLVCETGSDSGGLRWSVRRVMASTDV